jgi:cbb3-type cytochrome oxidase maturation protein
MFVPVWLYFVGTGTLMAVLTLVWAVRSRQFDDQDRARYLPLAGIPAAELARGPARRSVAARVTVGVMVLSGLFVLGSTLVVVLRHL